MRNGNRAHSDYNVVRNGKMAHSDYDVVRNGKTYTLGLRCSEEW